MKQAKLLYRQRGTQALVSVVFVGMSVFTLLCGADILSAGDQTPVPLLGSNSQSTVDRLSVDTIPTSAMRPPTQINIEVDWMYTSLHKHHLRQPEIEMMVAMFACQGITLNVEISDSIPDVNLIASSDTDIFGNMGPNGFGNLKSQYYDHTGQPGWHYCIMGHTLTVGGFSWAGYGEFLGDDFVVTLGDWPSEIGLPYQRAALFVHELGHNLGLGHSGNQNQNTVTQYKPNYASVMSYRYTVTGVRSQMLCWEMVDSCHLLPFVDLDYSHGTLPDLDENALDEQAGIGLGPVDWNCNGVIDVVPVAQDLGRYTANLLPNEMCGATGSRQVIRDYDDWSHIVDVTFATPAAVLNRRPVITCFSHAESLPHTVTDVAGEPPCAATVPSVGVQPCVVTYADNADGDSLRDGCDPCPAFDIPGGGDIMTGDATGDGARTSADIISLVNYVFKGGPAPEPIVAVGDCNCNGTTTSADVILMVNHVFKSGPEPCDVCALP